MSGYLGSIGFGFPAAMGAWAAAPDRPIVAVTGDGGFGQYLAEMTTAVKYGIPIRHVLLDNGVAGQDLEGATGRRVRRVADVAASTPTSPPTPSCAGRRGSASPTRDSSTTR